MTLQITEGHSVKTRLAAQYIVWNLRTSNQRFIAISILAAAGLFCNFLAVSIHIPAFLQVDQRGLGISLRSSSSSMDNAGRYFLDLTNDAERTQKIFSGTRVFQDDQIKNYQNTRKADISPSSNDCRKWAVMAVIDSSTKPASTSTVLQKMEAAVPTTGDWCTVVMASEAEWKQHNQQQRRSRKQKNSQFHVVSISQIQRQGGEATKAFLDTLLLGISSSSKEASSVIHSIYKNAGYLYALQHGAEHILDLEFGVDMADLWKNLEATYFSPSENSNTGKDKRNILMDVPLVGDVKVLNPHSYIFRNSNNDVLRVDDKVVLGSTWPRGYPKQHGRPTKAPSNVIALNKRINTSRIGIVHQLSSVLDCDTQGSLMMRAATNSSLAIAGNHQRRNPLLVPRHTMTPYNAQATLHTSATLWATLLPTTLPSRIADIWRSYIAQSLFASLDLHTIVVPPPSIQQTSTGLNEENSGNDNKIWTKPAFSSKNLEADVLFYTQVPDLMLSLEQYATTSEESTTASVPQKVEALWIHLYEEGFIAYKDVLLVQHWLRVLIEESSYSFDSLHKGQLLPYYRNVVLMGQFNFATYPKEIPVNDISSASLLQMLDDTNNKRDWTVETIDNEKILVVQQDISEMVAFWVQKWREVFTRVVVRGPFSKEQLQILKGEYGIDAHGIDSSRWKHTLEDKGLYSPIQNLVNTLEDYEKEPSIDGVIYIHDDSFLNVFDLIQKDSTIHQSLSQFPADQVLVAGQGERDSYFDPRMVADKTSISRRSYNIYPNGTFSNPNGQQFGSDQTALLQSLEYWPWNPEHCLPRLAQLAKDPRVASYRETTGDQAGSILIPPWEPADFLFVPTKYARTFVDIASVFLDHEVFLECAIPTILDMMRLQNKDAALKTTDLCTSWNESVRGSDAMISECIGPAPTLPESSSINPSSRQSSFGFFHPYKLSTNGFTSWDAMFDLVTHAPFQTKANTQ